MAALLSSALLPYLLGGAVLLVMLFAAGFDDGRRREARDWERRRLQREITDLECWLEIADRKSAAEANRELKQRSRSVITDEPGQIIYVDGSSRERAIAKNEARKRHMADGLSRYI